MTELKTDPSGLAAPTTERDPPMLDGARFAALLRETIREELQPLKAGQEQQRDALAKLADRMLQYEDYQTALGTQIRLLERSQAEVTRIVKSPSWVAWAALAIGLVDLGGLLAVLVAMGLR